VQKPGCSQHRQIRPRAGQELQTQNPPKNARPSLPETIQDPEAHHQFIEQTLDEWLKLAVVKKSNSLYNSPIFCIPKKQGQGLCIVHDF
jgi:hypothetical protein